MATLDVLDYVVRLDEALAPSMKAAERKLAVRDVRHLVEDLAFRFAFMDDRIVPEDIDYARALEALKEPPVAAAAFAARRPVYAKRVRRKSAVRWGVLTVVALLGFAFWALVTSETADPLVDEWSEGSREPIDRSFSRAFEVAPGTSRLQWTANVIVLDDRSETRENAIILTVLDPNGQARHEKVFTADSSVFDKGTIEAPMPGTWEVYVDYRAAAGSSEVTILGVRRA